MKKTLIYVWLVALGLTLAVIPMADGAYNVPLPLAGDATGTTSTVQNTKINGTSVPAGGALTTGNAAYVSGASAATYSALNLAGGAGWVSGQLPIGNLGIGTAGQIPVTNAGATADVFVTISGDETMTSTGAVTNTKINGTTVPAGGSLTTGNACYVSGSSACTYSAVNLAGGAGWVSGQLPVANVANGTAGQILVTNSGATAPAWVTASGDVTIAASGAHTVAAISGSTPIAVTPNEFQWATGATGPLLDQASESSAIKGADFSIAPQTSTHTTDQGGGNVKMTFEVPTGAGVEAGLQVYRGATIQAAIQPFNTGTGLGVAGTIHLNNAALSSTNWFAQGAGGLIFLNGSTELGMGVGGGLAPSMDISASGIQLFGRTAALGGGSGVLGIHTSTTQPTTAPTAGGVLSQDAVGLHYDGPSTSFSDFVIAPTQQGTANTQGEASRRYSGVGRTTTNSAVTILTIPVATSTTAAMLDVNCIGRDVSAGTVGDFFAYKDIAAFTNVAGTVTGGNTLGTAITTFKTSMSTCTITYSISGTNVLVQATGLSSVVVDWTCESRAIIN